MGKVIAVCVSDKKGTAKTNVGSCLLIRDFGLENDAHAGSGLRQVSLLPYERFKEYAAEYGDIDHGAFGENLLVEGYDLKTFTAGTIIECGEAVMEVTQIGKECHTGCDIAKRNGKCIMPAEGIFARVLKGGMVRVGDRISVHGKYRLGIITSSDKGSTGERRDESGPLIRDTAAEWGYETVSYTVLPDDEDSIYSELVRLADTVGCDVVLTTGGTGFSVRDVTPEATIRAATRNAPGIAEAIRAESLKITPRAMLSRGASVIRNRCVIVNLPGSPKAVRESLEIILPSLSHGIDILKGDSSECGGK
ncbi:MAG: MOSC domain-containing protein [Ruminococcus sp.]|nr:MOSC domain-containing protein [Ruminococcus sp.]